MSNLWGREPTLVLAVVEAVIALAIGFGLALTAEQFALIMALITAVIGVVVRSQVTPVN